MTFTKLGLFSFVQWLIMAFLKVWFFNHEIFSNPGIQKIVFWLLAMALSVALVRRLGVIQILEVGFIIFCWVVLDLILDVLVVSPYTGASIFSTAMYWFSFVFIMLGVAIFHKKRHIQVRHELHGSHHGHGHDAHANHDHKKPHH